MNIKKFLTGFMLVVIIFSTTTTTLASGVEPQEETTPMTQVQENSITNKSSSEIHATLAPNGAIEATPQQVIKGNSQQKTGVPNPLSNVPSSNALAASWVYNSRFTYYYSQQLSYSCGPACVRGALHNINGSAPSEESVRKGCGTTTSGTFLFNMVTYINQQQNHNHYVSRYQQSQSTMRDNLYSGIVTWDAQPIVGLTENTATGWPYGNGTVGHFVRIYAVMSNKSAFMISDPWAGYINDFDNSNYSKTTSQLYKAYNSIDCGYMF